MVSVLSVSARKREHKACFYRVYCEVERKKSFLVKFLDKLKMVKSNSVSGITDETSV